MTLIMLKLGSGDVCGGKVGVRQRVCQTARHRLEIDGYSEKTREAGLANVAVGFGPMVVDAARRHLRQTSRHRLEIDG